MVAPIRPYPEGERDPLPVEYSFTYTGSKDADKNSAFAANRKAMGLFIEAQNHYKEGHFQEATESYRRARDCAVKRFVPLIDAHMVDALVADAAKKEKTDPGASEALLREALLIEPRMELAGSRLDRLLQNRGVAATDFNARMKLAEDFDGKREFGPALVEYTRALELLDKPGRSQDPLTVDRLRAKVAEAISRLRQGHTREEDNWRRFLSTSPNSLEALMALARIVEPRDRREAIELLTRAQKLQPGNQTVVKELERLQRSGLEASGK
ncbi:MAG: tetratricopeptide repeat protein, partial [Candidatus Obscuribacterales bacterium]